MHYCENGYRREENVFLCNVHAPNAEVEKKMFLII